MEIVAEMSTKYHTPEQVYDRPTNTCGELNSNNTQAYIFLYIFSTQINDVVFTAFLFVVAM